jgi:hypothetical protein
MNEAWLGNEARICPDAVRSDRLAKRDQNNFAAREIRTVLVDYLGTSKTWMSRRRSNKSRQAAYVGEKSDYAKYKASITFCSSPVISEMTRGDIAAVNAA